MLFRLILYLIIFSSIQVHGEFFHHWQQQSNRLTVPARADILRRITGTENGSKLEQQDSENCEALFSRVFMDLNTIEGWIQVYMGSSVQGTGKSSSSASTRTGTLKRGYTTVTEIRSDLRGVKRLLCRFV